MVTFGKSMSGVTVCSIIVLCLTAQVTCQMSKSTKGEIEQWIYRVIRVSSQFTVRSWSANQVIGRPNVYPKYGDIPKAWAPRTRDSNQYVEVEFQHFVYPSAIRIYETFNAGGVTAIKARPEGGAWETMWSTKEPKLIENSRIFSPRLKVPSFATREIRIDVDCTAAGKRNYVEIDAVMIQGTTEPYSTKSKSTTTKNSGQGARPGNDGANGGNGTDTIVAVVLVLAVVVGVFIVVIFLMRKRLASSKQISPRKLSGETRSKTTEQFTNQGGATLRTDADEYAEICDDYATINPDDMEDRIPFSTTKRDDDPATKDGNGEYNKINLTKNADRSGLTIDPNYSRLAKLTSSDDDMNDNGVSCTYESAVIHPMGRADQGSLNGLLPRSRSQSSQENTYFILAEDDGHTEEQILKDTIYPTRDNGSFVPDKLNSPAQTNQASQSPVATCNLPEQGDYFILEQQFTKP